MLKLLVAILLLAPDSLTEHPTLQQMYQANNDLRHQQHLGAQRLSKTLTKAAQDHAWYMAKQHDLGQEDFEHRGKNGTPGQRAARYNYEGLVRENLARGYLSVAATFQAWLDSPEHRAAVYGDNLEVGFGYALAKDGTTYWVSLYGTPRIIWDLIDSPSPLSKKSIPPFSLIP